MIVKVQDEMREGLYELVSALVKASGIKHVVSAIHRWWCGQGDPGHHYSVVCIGADEFGTWVLDPNATCKGCGTPMSEDAYDRMVVLYAEMTEATGEDELW